MDASSYFKNLFTNVLAAEGKTASSEELKSIDDKLIHFNIVRPYITSPVIPAGGDGSVLPINASITGKVLVGPVEYHTNLDIMIPLATKGIYIAMGKHEGARSAHFAAMEDAKASLLVQQFLDTHSAHIKVIDAPGATYRGVKDSQLKSAVGEAHLSLLCAYNDLEHWVKKLPLLKRHPYDSILPLKASDLVSPVAVTSYEPSPQMMRKFLSSEHVDIDTYAPLAAILSQCENKRVHFSDYPAPAEPLACCLARLGDPSSASSGIRRIAGRNVTVALTPPPNCLRYYTEPATMLAESKEIIDAVLVVKRDMNNPEGCNAFVDLFGVLQITRVAFMKDPNDPLGVASRVCFVQQGTTNHKSFLVACQRALLRGMALGKATKFEYVSRVDPLFSDGENRFRNMCDALGFPQTKQALKKASAGVMGVPGTQDPRFQPSEFEDLPDNSDEEPIDLPPEEEEMAAIGDEQDVVEQVGELTVHVRTPADGGNGKRRRATAQKLLK